MRILRLILLIVIAIVLGLGVAIWRIAGLERNSAFIKYGSWTGTNQLALNTDDLVTTQVTCFALFALPSYEAVYLFARKDDNDERLKGDNTYTIEGNIHNYDVGYWSITAYGKDLYLMPNEAQRFAFNSNTLTTDSAGNFSITVSAEKKGNNWLPVKKGEKFELVLRLYQGERGWITHLSKARLPVIKKAV